MRRVMLAATTIVLVLAVYDPALAQHQRYGVVSSYLDSGNADDLDVLNVGWVRILIPWSDLEQSQGVWNYNGMHAQLDLARDRGVKVFATLAYPPSWRRRAASGVGSNYPNDLNVWEDYVENCIREFAVNRTDIEIIFSIWNEPNDYNNENKATPTEYGALFQRANTARNNVKPSAKLAGPSTFYSSSPSLSSYISAMGTAFKSSDIAAVHWYDNQFDSSKPDASELCSYMQFVGARTGGRVMYLSETGYNGTSISLVPIFDAFDSGCATQWKKTFIFHLKTPAPDAGYSLVNASTDARYARFYWYMDYIAAHTWNGQNVSLYIGGWYVAAEYGGGSYLYADRTSVGEWERFQLLDINGGDLMDGDKVALKADSGQWVQAEGGGGPNKKLMAIASAPNSWEQFTLVDLDNPGGAVGSSDRIALRSSGGYYIVAELGGGYILKVDRTSIGAWETFILNRE